MKGLIIIFNLFFATFIITNVAFSQSYTTVSKACGSCGGVVSSLSRIGQRCPHCSVIWGRENEKRSTHTVKKRQTSNSTSTITNCNLRLTANPKSVIIGVIPSYQNITIIQQKGFWVKVKYLGYLFGEIDYKYHIGWVQINGINN